MKLNRVTAAVATGVGLIAILVLLCPSQVVSTVVDMTIAPCLKTRAFDSGRWRTRALDGDARWPTRLRMADDLVASGRLSGASRAEVERLLGPPDNTTYFSHWSMVYWLGPERGMMPVDSEWLVLRIGAQGTVTECRIARD